MEFYTNFILTLIFISIVFLIMFLKRNISTNIDLIEVISIFTKTIEDNNNLYEFCKLHIERVENQIEKLSSRIKKL